MLKIIICSDEDNRYDGTFVWKMHCFLMKRNDVNGVSYLADEPVMPQDGDLYILFGNAEYVLPNHIGSNRIIRFGALHKSAINAPLDALEMRISGHYGKDHTSLTAEQTSALNRKIAEIEALPKLQFHLSMDGNLPKHWQPRVPTGDHGDQASSKLDVDEREQQRNGEQYVKSILLTETHQARICTSSTIKGCFYGIYPNISDEFDRADKGYMDFYVYLASGYKTSAFLDTRTLVDNRMVWDAHLTEECNILSSADMTLLPYKVRVYNDNVRQNYTNKRYHNWIHPYDDPKEKQLYHSPIITFDWVKSNRP